jgi:hypothetical protein
VRSRVCSSRSADPTDCARPRPGNHGRNTGVRRRKPQLSGQPDYSGNTPATLTLRNAVGWSRASPCTRRRLLNIRPCAKRSRSRHPVGIEHRTTYLSSKRQSGWENGARAQDNGRGWNCERTTKQYICSAQRSFAASRDIGSTRDVFVSALQTETPLLCLSTAGTPLHTTGDPYRHAMMNTRK